MKRAVSEKPLNERLLEGARVLGALFRSGQKCKGGFRLVADDGAPDCPCQAPTKFCKAKIQWALLALSAERDLEEGEYGLILTMRLSELEASGFTVTFEFPETGALKAGPKGACTTRDLVELWKDPESAGHVLRLMARFPGSKMEFPKKV